MPGRRIRHPLLSKCARACKMARKIAFGISAPLPLKIEGEGIFHRLRPTVPGNCRSRKQYLCNIYFLLCIRLLICVHILRKRIITFYRFFICLLCKADQRLSRLTAPHILNQLLYQLIL